MLRLRPQGYTQHQRGRGLAISGPFALSVAKSKGFAPC